MPLRDDLLAPIAGANPSGINLRYDPITDKIKEARREELEAPQGAWKSAVKIADYPQVIKLASDAIAKRGKDLQLAVWLVDAHIRREHFAVIPSCFKFLHDLCDQFWETVHPEMEDGDLEVRVTPLEWLGSRLDEPIRLLPITPSGLSWFRYKESRTVGYEAEATTEEKRKNRNQLITEGKISADEFDQAILSMPKEFCEKQFAYIAESLEKLEEFTSFLDEKFGDLSPSFIKVRTALEENAQVVKGFISKKGGPTPAVVATPVPVATVVAEPAPPPVQQAVAVAQPAAVAPESPVVSSPGATSASLQLNTVDDASHQLAAIATFLRFKDVYDISPYLILRGFRWGEIRYNGPDEIDASMLVPPEDHTRSDLNSAFTSGQWDKVLDLTEKAMELPCGRGWLDLQRYTVKALEGKGQYFAFVADGVRTGVRGLIQDLPNLLQMSLRDGSPTADADTKDWIEKEVLAGVSMTFSSPVAKQGVVPDQPAVQSPAVELNVKPPQLEDEPITEGESSDIFDQALQQARGGKAPEAIAALTRQLSSEVSGRGRFKRRVQIAHLLMAGGSEQIAQPILNQIAQEIESRKLEEWEIGEAVAYPLSLLLRCSSTDEDLKKRMYAAVCRLDPARALLLPV